MEEPASETLGNSLVQGLSSIGTETDSLAVTLHWEMSAHFHCIGWSGAQSLVNLQEVSEQERGTAGWLLRLPVGLVLFYYSLSGQ